jgi:hypothetical protein
MQDSSGNVTEYLELDYWKQRRSEVQRLICWYVLQAAHSSAELPDIALDGKLTQNIEKQSPCAAIPYTGTL